MVSTLPQSEQTVTLSWASAMATHSGDSSLFAILDEVQCGAARRAGAESRQFCQKLDEPLNFGAGGSFHAQKGSFMPGGSGRPPVTDFISSAIMRLALCLGIGVGGHDEIFENFLLIGLAAARNRWPALSWRPCQ